MSEKNLERFQATWNCSSASFHDGKCGANALRATILGNWRKRSGKSRIKASKDRGAYHPGHQRLRIYEAREELGHFTIVRIRCQAIIHCGGVELWIVFATLGMRKSR